MTDEPSWHEEVLGRPPRRLTSSVAGARIAVRAWGDPDAPTLVLVHGGAAHSGWWDLVGPALAPRFHVLAPDLSGHGDSDWRTAYGLDAWSTEVARVIRDHSRTERPVLVGHSMGGHVALVLARTAGAGLGGVITIDSEVRSRDASARPRRWRAIDQRDRRVHPDEATILAHFRTLPDESRAPAHVLDHVARQSIVRNGDGWSWKFDRRFVEHAALVQEDLRPLDCPVLVVRGRHGIVDEVMATAVEQRLRPDRPTLTVAGAGHHVPLEAPRRLAATIADTADTWTTPTAHPPLETR